MITQKQFQISYINLHVNLVPLLDEFLIVREHTIQLLIENETIKGEYYY